MDDRYRKNYNMSIKDNLETIKRVGIGEFIKDQHQKYRCSRCGALTSVHNGMCFKCETITTLVIRSVQRKAQGTMLPDKHRKGPNSS